ncbi:hypothetical protein [Nonomuraea sp. NPDC050643]|uniref:hypothetical protein n=1 Tax=Nonomuraea sp. NPDC050643 TaxID=3155660 RepID=UPI003402D289
MSEHVCPGRCNARPRRQVEEHARAVTAWQKAMAEWIAADPTTRGAEPDRPAEPTLRWTAGTPLWCLNDSAAIRAALTDLDEQMTLRLLAADGHGSLNLEERVSGSVEPPSPSPAHDQLDELVRWLRDWERAYRDTQGWPPAPYRGESAPALTSCVAWLAAHLDGLLAHPDLSVAFGSGVLSWHAEISAAAKTKRRRIAMQMRCPQCHLATLSKLDGEDRIECHNRDCGANRGGPAVLTLDEYAGLAEGALIASGRGAS